MFIRRWACTNLSEQENDIGVESQEGIIIWHIATELQVFIAKSRGYDDAEDAGDQVKDIRTLSNYIIFLLVDRPHMLLGSQHVIPANNPQ